MNRGALMAGLMMTQFMPMGENCDTFAKLEATAGLAVGTGGEILDKFACETACAPCYWECIPKPDGCTEKCMEDCRKRECGWLPGGQWARGDLFLFMSKKDFHLIVMK